MSKTRTSCWMTLVAKSFLTTGQRFISLSGFSFLIFLLLFLSGCSDPQPVRLQGATMGTSYSVVLPNLPEGKTEQLLKQDIDELLDGINHQMSTYLSNSELSAVNDAEAEQWLPLSDELFDVIQLAQTVSAQSDGAFDITVGPLVNLWGFGPVEEGAGLSEPTEEALASARAGTGYKHLLLDAENQSLQKAVSGLYIDLSAIAKGYGVDALAAYLDDQGVKDYLVEIGGELRARGVSHRGDPWRIALEKPEQFQRDIQRVITLSNIGIATSGDYRNYVEYEGKRYSHTIDPRTARPVSHQLTSVTVLADSTALADAWATALMVLGEEEGYKLAQEQGLAAYFLYRKDDSLASKETAAFERLSQP